MATEVDVRAGSEVRLVVPELHRLDVRVPEQLAGNQVSVTSTEASRPGSARVSTDPRGVANLRGLPAGPYRVTCSGTSAREVVLPCNEVVLALD